MRVSWKWLGLAGYAGLLFAAPVEAQLVWDSHNPVTQAKTLKGVIWTGGQYVAVGDSGTIVTSSDGTTWATRNSGITSATTHLYGVAAGSGSTLVAVGGSGTIVRSTNSGSTWSIVSGVPAPTQTLYGITWSGSLFVAVGTQGTILTSPDGQEWTQRANSLTARTLSSVAWSGSGFVAVGDHTSPNVEGAVRSSDGVNWTLSSSGASLYNVIWAGNKFIGVGFSGAIRESSDGASWSPVTSGGNSLLGVALGTSLVSVGMGGTIRYSLTSSTWNTVTASPTTAQLNAVTTGGPAVYLAVGAGGVVVTSTDAQNWVQTSSLQIAFYGLTARFGSAAGDTQFVAVGDFGTIVTSPTGAAWTRRSSGLTSSLYAAGAGGTTSAPVLATAGAGGVILTSTDAGVTWTTRASTVTTNLFGVAGNATGFPGTTLVAVGASTIVVSTNGGASWAAPSASNADLLLKSVAWSPTSNAWVAVGDTGGIRRATNPMGAWALGSVKSNGIRLNAVVWAGTPVNKFIAVGNSGIIYSSTTGSNNSWVKETSGITANLQSITQTAGLLVATGDGGTVLTSPNGADWTRQTSGVSNILYGAKWNGKVVAAVGAGGRILTSSPAALPPAPDPQSPAAAAVNLPVSPILSWSAPSGATAYIVQVSNNASFSDTVFIDTVSTTNVQAGPFTPSAHYYWRVLAMGNTGSSDWSVARDFTIITVLSSYPSLSTPAANAIDVALSPTLSWAAYTGATAYRVQASTDSVFSSTLVNDSIAETSRFLGNLNPNTVYYWRVYARLASGVTAWSPRRKFTTTPPPPAAPSLSSPFNGFAGTPLSGITLSWGAVSGASGYRVQVSTSSTFASFLKDTVVQGVTLASGTLSANTQYYWRVNSQNGAGSSAYSAVRTFTTYTSVPSKPTLVSPSHNATDVSVFTDLAWQAANGTANYHLQLSTDSNFTTTFLIDDTTLASTVTSRNVGQLADQTWYYWRVQGRNPVGAGAWSNRATFRSGSVPTTPPAAPSLVSPAAFATNVSSASALFTWNAPATATGYAIEISLDPSFPGTVVAETTTTTSRTVTTLSGGLAYYWRVKARNNVGFGAYSEVRAFSTVATRPGKPVLTTPAQFSTGISVTPTLTWNAVPGATSYRVQVSTSNTFSGAMTVNDSLTGTSRAVGSLAGLTDYYWRVIARNAAGADTSTIFRFTTGAAPLPTAPTPLSPLQFAANVPFPVVLVWSRVAVASTYKVQLSTDPAFATFVFQDSIITDTARSIPSGLSTGTDYYWRVFSKNSAGTSAASSTFRFTTTTVSILGRLALQRKSSAAAGGLRFVLPTRERVLIRVFDTRGGRLRSDFDKVLEGGAHVIPLPEGLESTFFLIEFQAGNFREVLKVHP